MFDRLDELRQSKALTRARGSEKTDRQRGLGAPVRGELREKAERRGEPECVGSARNVSGKDGGGSRNRFRRAAVARERRRLDGRRIRLPPGTRDDRSNIAQSPINHNIFLSLRASFALMRLELGAKNKFLPGPLSSSRPRPALSESRKFFCLCDGVF